MFGARSAGAHDRIPFSTLQLDGPLAKDQSTPVALGSASESDAERAAVPPLLAAVMVNPIDACAATPVESGVTVTPSTGAAGAGV